MLDTVPVLDRLDLVPAPVAAVLAAWPGADRVRVAEIDPDLADTAEFCQRYGVALEASANCVVVAGKGGGRELLAACVVLAVDRADVNGVLRRHLGARKLSFAPMDTAVGLTGMEYGGITPIGLPAAWPILIDRAVGTAGDVVIGGGSRGSKLVVPGELLAELPGALVLDLALPH